MAQSLINVLKLFLPIIISGNVLISACLPVSISSVTHSSSSVSVYDHPDTFDRSVADVDRLHDAIIYDDRSEIIDIFITKNLYNRASLHEEHINAYGSDLKALCQSQLSGDFGHLITSLATPPWFFLANELHYIFFQSSYHEYSTIEEILGYHDIERIKEAYQSEYGVEMTKDFRKLPYFLRQRFADQIDGIYSGSRRFMENQADWYRKKLVEAAINSDTRYFTRLIVTILNDGILDEVRMSYRYVYDEPLARLVNQFPNGDYREAISAILSPSRPYGDDMVRGPYYTKIVTSYSI